MAYDTTQELLDYLAQEVGDTEPSSATETRYLNLLNQAHRSIVSGGGELNLDDVGNPIRRPFIFPWAVAAQPKIITLIPLQEGTVTITQNSASATSCSINSSSTDMSGWHIRFTGDDSTVYYISTHSGTTLTLDGPVMADNETGASFEAFKLIYSVGSDDILLPTDKLRSSRLRTEGYFVSMASSNALFDKFPLSRIVKGPPKMAAIIKQTGGNLQLQISHAPEEYQRLELWYVPIPDELDTSSSDPILPNYKTCIAHLAAFYHLRKRDDDKAQSHFGTAKGLFDCLTTEARQIMNANDDTYGYIAPWSGSFDGASLRQLLINTD